jgi:hypothetical protein
MLRVEGEMEFGVLLEQCSRGGTAPLVVDSVGSWRASTLPLWWWWCSGCFCWDTLCWDKLDQALLSLLMLFLGRRGFVVLCEGC